MAEHALYTKEFARSLLDPEHVPDLFEGDRARIEAGLDIYRNNVMHSLIAAMADIYPVVRALVGEEFFRGLARTYIRAEPPASPVLADYGRGFPQFLAGFEPARQAPYLPDVARLERAWLDAFHAPDAEPLASDVLAEEPPEHYAAAEFTCHPSLHVVASSYPVCTIWTAHQEPGPIPEISLDLGAEESLIIRPGMDVRVHTAPRGTAAFVAALSARMTLGAALEAVSAGTAGFELAAVMSLLIDTGAFTEISIQTRESTDREAT